MSFFISSAYAADAGASGSPMASFIIFLPLIAIMYFMIFRPQQKRAKEHATLVAGLGKGDEIVTSGGILGKIVNIDDNFIQVKISDNGEMKIQRHAVHAVMPKGTFKS